MTKTNPIQHSLIMKSRMFLFALFAALSLSFATGCNGEPDAVQPVAGLSAPSGITVTESETQNTVEIKWTDNGSPYYWIYYNSENDTSTATCKTKAADSLTSKYGYEITLPSSGIWYFWVKSADGYSSSSETSDFSTPVSFNFTYTSLSVPSGITVSASETKNTVEIKWTDNGSPYYWIYYNSENDTSTATCKTKAADSLTSRYGYKITLPSSGTWYFWVKSADGYTSSSVTSDFSESAQFDFTYTALTAPTDVSIEGEGATVKIKWTDNNSAYYWIYYNSENDTSTATCKTKAADSLTSKYGYEITLPSSGIWYFWVKSADGYSSSSVTSDFSTSATYSYQD